MAITYRQTVQKIPPITRGNISVELIIERDLNVFKFNLNKYEIPMTKQSLNSTKQKEIKKMLISIVSFGTLRTSELEIFNFYRYCCLGLSACYSCYLKGISCLFKLSMNKFT